MINTTRAQRTALKRIWMRGADERTYRELRRDVLVGHDCLMLRWAGMWLGIERDGYTHS
jgi:predicted NBD/HSP70 family sugar kinase